ncbi:hypothetical protein H0H93_013011 [Arthromyces matolae]|nr:hypothetical protein H0H93_013011 [Arthromyces matolae]
MAVSKDSPKRRKSIAVTNQNKPAVIPRSKRRPHSIVPGDRLSPFAKARRSMAPRKSILKTFTNILHNDIDTSTSQFQSESQSTYPPSSLDDTTSMDITRDLGRKSLGGRRVSFAESVHVRLIQNLKKDKDQVNEVDDMDTSPVIHQPQPSIRFETNENDYPGAASSSRRRSSTRYSLGEDMDLTSIAPQGFLTGNGSALMDEELDFGGYEEDPMDMTEVVQGKSVRERSTSVDRRTPFAPLEQKMQEPLFDGDKSQSFEESDSQALSEDHSGLMDFTMPLSKSQRPPAEQDAVWHALRQATHSGDTPIEHEISSEDGDQENVPYTNDAMDLDDALQRLMRARASLPSVLAMTMPAESEHLDDSFSTEGSFEDEQNQTINVSAVYGQPIGRPDGRQSIGSAMDESEVYGAIDVQAHSTPRNPTVPPPQPSQSNSLPPPAQLFPSVFQPPPETPSASSETPSIANQQTPKPVFTRPSTPSKTKTPSLSPTKAKGFTAAFAPPTVRPSPNKRSRVDDGPDSVRLSPAKRPSLSGGRPARAESPGLPSLKAQPGPLSSSKKVPYQNSAPSSQRPTSTIRRPSGYFARRKSVGADAASQPQLQEHENVLNSPRNQVAGLGHGGASMVVESDEGHTEHENSSPTPTGLSPAPALPLYKAAPAMDVSRAPDLPIIEASGIFTRDEFEVDDIDINTDATERWRNAVEPQDDNDIDEPAISIREFFNMTGIKFMDELTAPRRSIHPSQRVTALQPREPEQIPLAEYAVAIGLDLPQLALFTRVSKDLEAWIEKSKADFLLAEDEATTITPELFREYSRADQEGQAELLHQLQLIRTNTRASAKSDWYDWKLQWLEGLRVTAVQTFNSLQSDAKTLEAIRSSTNDVIPALRLEYEEIRKELEKESAEVKEIEACDQDYLNELKASIAEQNIEVEALRAEVAESKAKLLALQQRLKETDTEKQETRAAIDESQRVLHIQRNGTRAEVFRLKSTCSQFPPNQPSPDSGTLDELESLENLHMLHVTQVKADVFEYVHAAQYRVSIPCRSYEPIASRINIERLDKTRRVKDNFPRLSDFLLNMAKEEIIHRLSDYWSSCAQLRAQLMLLLIKFPVEIEVIRTSPSESPGFRAKVMVIFPSVKAKAFISFVFVGKAYSYWPVAIDTLEIEIEVAYGKIEREVIAKAVVDRLSQATAEDNYACLLDACIEAQEIYY